MLELLVEDAGRTGLAVELEGGTGLLLVLPWGCGCVAELVTWRLGTYPIVGLEGPTVEALLITGIGIDANLERRSYFGSRPIGRCLVIVELATGLMVE